MKRCKFCEKLLNDKEETAVHGLCYECFHLRRIIWRIGWDKRRVVVMSDPDTEKRISSWLCKS